MPRKERRETVLRGLALSNGCVVGRVCLFNDNRHVSMPFYKVCGDGIEHEKERVKDAITIARERLDEVRDDVERELGKAEAEIFVAHIMVLNDEVILKDIDDRIEKDKVNAETAVSQAFGTYEARLLALENKYLKERASDLADIKQQLLNILHNVSPGLECGSGPDCQRGHEQIIVASELTPSLTMDVDSEHTIAFVTEKGGINSHAAILARAMGIPAVSGLQAIKDYVGCGTELIVDGNTGEVIVWPTDDSIEKKHAAHGRAMRPPKRVEPVEGFKVMANISLVSDIELAKDMGAEGVGLYRTEFEIIAAGRFFSEDELFERYGQIARMMGGTPVMFRLFDIGSDKSMPFMDIPHEENPSLGWRGTRLLLGRPEILVTQARALARVSEGGRIHVMYPMIIDLEQFLEIKSAFLDAVKDISCGEICHGIMFEVPSACMQAEELYEEIDFGSVGTNDLTQYLFAVDRDNDRVSYDYDPDRTVFWRLISQLSRVARKAGKPLSICGEMAGNPGFVEELIDAGIDSVSVSSMRISNVRLAAEAILKERQKDK